MKELEMGLWPDLEKDLSDKLLAILKEKLPVEVDEAILKDIIVSQNKLIEEYLRGL
jgi:hypothetical protein